jgi:hypothetical protein
VNSSAPVGDGSLSIYAADLSDSSIIINTGTHGSFSIDNMNAAMQGIQVYEINTTPANITGISNPDNKYYAVFPVSSTATYSVAYNYADYPDAVNSNSIIDLYSRGSADLTWMSAGFAKDTVLKTFTNTAQTGASEFILGNFITNPLPLDLIAFNVEKTVDQSKTLLSWVVADAIEEASFEIERSNDAVVFLNIGNVNAGTNNKNEKGNDIYQFTDAAPLSGTNFYRIKAIEKNGTFKYFPVKSVQFNATGNNISLFPNPANNQLTLNYTSVINTKLNVTIYDLSGKKISRQRIEVASGLSQYPIDISGISSSIFFVNVQDQQSNFQTTIKMIKK